MECNFYCNIFPIKDSLDGINFFFQFLTEYFLLQIHWTISSGPYSCPKCPNGWSILQLVPSIGRWLLLPFARESIYIWYFSVDLVDVHFLFKLLTFAMGFFVWLVFTALWAGVGGVLPMFLPTHEHRPLINLMLKLTAVLCYMM